MRLHQLVTLVAAAVLVASDKEDKTANLPGLGQGAKSGAMRSIKVGSLKSTAVSDAAFKLLKLDQAGDGLFQSPQLDKGVKKLLSNPKLATWVGYMNLFNKFHPGKEATMVNMFVTFYGDGEND
ncbi:hypothetical protein PHYPSEUDO_002789 [Phytophthora pseudosyringae]|uniref:RxLR effector protein n=1 Tax=Phytophthora pseudosyringae TaxID=221518 RepID=A0A8T1VXK6_9STRA|nr:hypothetical protein PHYPSEUDO_002789 [Phytophthora pseudosyringae]